MKYCGISDFVQQSGKTLSMLLESKHSKTAKHGEFLYIFFEHWKSSRGARIKKAKDKLQLYLDTLSINYNPDTILALIQFAQSITPHTVHTHTNNDVCEIENDIKIPRTIDTSLTLKLSFDFNQLYINLNKPHLNRQIVEFGLSKTHITFKLRRDLSCDLHGWIGNLTANDLTFEGLYAAKKNKLDCTILGLRDANSKTLLVFNYITELIDAKHHRYHQELKVTLSSVKFNYHQLLVMEIVDYINMGILGLIYSQQPQPQPQKQNIAATDSVDDLETKLFYTVSIDKPVIVFPHCRGNEHSLDFDLGSIIIGNKFERHKQEEGILLVEDIHVEANDMQVIGSHNRSLRMVKVSLHVDVRRGVDSVVILEPNMQITLHFDRFQITMTQQHYIDILNMLNGNFWAKPSNIRIPRSSIGDDNNTLSFKTKKAQYIYSKYDEFCDKSTLNCVIMEINELIKNSALNNMNQHIFVDELMKLRVFYEQLLFDYTDNHHEEKKSSLPSYSHLASSMLQRQTSSVFVHETPLLPPPPIPHRPLSKQKRVLNEYDAIVKYTETPNNMKSKSAVHFNFDSVAEEYMTMHVLVLMQELKLSLCDYEKEEAFCEFSIDGFKTEWNRAHNGDHNTYLRIGAIQLIQKGGKQQYNQLLCPFDHIQMFVNKEEENAYECKHHDSKKERPELIFSYDSSLRTSKLIVNEPCGFLLPSLIKRLQEFADVSSRSDVDIVVSDSDIAVSKGNNDDITQFVAQWTSNTEFKLNNGKFICLENAYIVNTNAVVLNVSLAIKHGSVPIIGQEQSKCIIHSDMKLVIDSLSALICPANQIYNVGEHGGVRMHTIIEQQRFKCDLSLDETMAMQKHKLNRNTNSKCITYRDMEINGCFDKIDFTISFIDIQIFENIMKSIQNTFSPQNTEALSCRVSSLLPTECGLRDNFALLLKEGYCAELCFEALMEYKDLKLAALYCSDYALSFSIRKERGDIQSLIDLLPSRMYHNFGELCGRFGEEEIIRALIISDNQLDKATIILNQEPIDYGSFSIDNNELIDDYMTNDAYDDDADDEEDDDEMVLYQDAQDAQDGGDDDIVNQNKLKIKMNLTFESEKGIEINLINDVLSSSAMPFVGIKLYSQHLVLSRDMERTKGTLSFSLFASYYNPMIVAMEPLVESSAIMINWNSHAQQSELYTIKVNIEGIKHERSALVPRIIPFNVNITHIFAETLLSTLHSWSHFAALGGNRIITSWKPFYIVNKTGEMLYVWPSSERDRKQMIKPMEVEALAVRGGVRAAFTGRLLKYNRLEISFRVGNVASFEQISVFQNRRRKIMHKKHGVCVVLHTVFRRGSKFVYIWSPTEIRNHSARALHIRLHNDNNIVDFGIIEPGSSVPVPLSINSLEAFISFKPVHDVNSDEWRFTKMQKIRDLIRSQKFTLIKSKSEAKNKKKYESFFLRPRYHRDLITIIIQSPLIITNLFPFYIRIQIKYFNNKKQSKIWEERIASYESLPVCNDLNASILMGVWLPGYGQSSEWIKLNMNGLNHNQDTPIPINISGKLQIFLSCRQCKSVPFFRDDAPATLAMNTFYLFTKYLFINKTGLELEIRSPKENLSIKQLEVCIFIFENERRNVHGEWVTPFEAHDIASQCDVSNRARNKSSVILPNKKWKWKSDWRVTAWEYALDFTYTFHSCANNDDCVRRRKWSRIRIPSGSRNQISTISCFGGASSKMNNKICCRILDRHHRTDWSQFIPLNEAVTNMVLSIKSLSNHAVFFDIAVIFELHRLYPSIKVIKFYARFVATNCCTFIDQLYIKPWFNNNNYNCQRNQQAQQERILYYRAPRATALHWFNIAPTRYIVASVDGVDWSSPFPIHEITQFPIRISNCNDSISGFSIIRVQSRTIGQTTIVSFRDERRDYPFFQIHNRTKYTIYYSQHHDAHYYPLYSSFAVAFAWNNLLIAKLDRKILLKIRNRIFSEKLISFESNGYRGVIDIFYIRIENRGATKVLTISERFIEEKDYDSSCWNAIDLNIRCESFGISLIDEMPSELLYISGLKLVFNLLLSRSRNEERIRFSLNSFQIDNQMMNAISPVLFVGFASLNKKTNVHMPWIQFECNTQNSSKYVETLSVRPQKFALSLDGATLQRLINFVYLFINYDTTPNDDNNGYDTTPMYFGELFLAPMEFIVSFRDLHEKSSSFNSVGIGSPLFADIMFQFGVVVVNFDCAVIRVSGYAERDRVFDSTTLINRLSSHYIGELLRGFFNIIGSLEILGNIAGLTNSVRSGLQDFWFEPQNGTTPGEVFRGFGKGTYSLLQQSIRGLTHSVSSLTSALGTGLAYASGDTEFAKQRSMMKGKQKNKPKNMADGIFKGGKKLASSTWDGISGIWKDPIQGGNEDGVKGAIAGFGQGVMGLVCKPLVGVMDLGSDLVSGIGNTLPSVTHNNILMNVEQIRLHRMFYGKMNIMKEYKYSDALINENLMLIKLNNNNNNNDNNNEGEQYLENNKNNFAFYSFEGSFETQPNHEHQLFIILGNGLLRTRWSQTKQNKLKFVDFYDWNSFFSISNRPGKRLLICTFKLDTANNHHQIQSNPNDSSSSLSLSRNTESQSQYRIKTQKDLKLPLKSAQFADLVSRKLQQYVEAPNYHHQ